MEAGRLVHLTREGDYQIGQQFDSSEEMARREYLRGLKGDRARSALSVRHITFRQGYDLGVFGTLDQAARETMKIIVEAHPKKIHPVPSDVDEWTKHMKFAISVVLRALRTICGRWG